VKAGNPALTVVVAVGHLARFPILPCSNGTGTYRHMKFNENIIADLPEKSKQFSQGFA